MSTVLGLIRHGETDWNKAKRIQGHTDVPLNEAGLAQAKQIATRLAKESWDVIYSSDLERAHVTAKTIAEATGLPVIVDERLREKNFGLVEGKTLEERIAKWGENYRTLDLQAETDEEIWARASAAIEKMLESHAGKKILVVSHGGTIARILRKLAPSIEITEFIHNTSLTELKHEQDQWSCTSFNCVKHL